jgi:sensor histidine kinase YesM
MHPILANRIRLGLYLLGWLPLAALLAAVLRSSGPLAWAEAGALAVPACLFYAGVCLASWYSCRVLPPAGGALLRLLFIHISAAVVSALLLVTVSKALALALSQVPALASLDQHYSPHQLPVFAMGVLLYLLAVGVFYIILTEQQSREAEQREAEARVLAREAELRALKAQINPHFLFNCLHSIGALVTVDAEKAREMCLRLSSFLRATLRLAELESVTVAEELEVVRGYLSIEQVRFGSRLNLEEQIDAGCQSCLLPPLILQPLVENAVKHGVAGLLEGGWIRIETHCASDRLRLAVENLFDPESSVRRRGGVGLANVRKRLYTRYGTAARMDVIVAENRYRVEFSLPCESSALSRA